MVIVQLEGKTPKTECGAEECGKKNAPVGEKPVSAAEAREKVAQLVWGNAGAIAEKLITVTLSDGQLGNVKYLFEMAGIHPASSEVTTSKPEESLVYSWLKELGLQAGTQGKDAVRDDGSGERTL